MDSERKREREEDQKLGQVRLTFFLLAVNDLIFYITRPWIFASPDESWRGKEQKGILEAAFPFRVNIINKCMVGTREGILFPQGLFFA